MQGLIIHGLISHVLTPLLVPCFPHHMNSDQQFQLAKLPKTLKFSIAIYIHMVFPSYIFMHYVLDPDNFRHSTCTKQHYYIDRASPSIPVVVYKAIP